MKKLFTLSVLFISLLMNAIAQPGTQKIRGTVTDKQSKYQLPGATVVVVGTDPLIGTVSDENGDFTLANVPLGRQTLKITMLGYGERVIPNIVVSQGKETIMNLDLEEAVIESQEIVVTDKQDKTATNNEMVSVSARQFSREEAARYAGAFNDPARMASNYAGVSNGNDGRNDIIIRGNSPLGLLWRLEGMPIPNPNHFGAQGTTGGPVSMLNYNQLANSDFMTGAFPAEYGNATSGVFDLKLRNGNNQKHEFVAQIGFNGLEAGAEGPFSKKYKGNFMINYRYSTLGIFQLLGVNFGTGTAVPLYQDLGFKVDLPTKNAGRFQIFGLGGISGIDYLNSKLDTTKNARNSYGFRGFDTYFKTRMGLVGVTHNYFFNTLTSLKTGAVISYNDVYTRQDSIIYPSTAVFEKTFFATTSETRLVVSSILNRKINAKLTVNGGIYFHNIGVNYDQNFYSPGANAMLKLTNINGSVQLLELYAQGQYKFNNRLTLNGGVHYQNFLYNGKFAVEPRLGFRYALLPNFSINGGLGIHNQLQPLVVYFREQQVAQDKYVKTNKDLDFTKSNHAILGFDWNMGSNWRIKTEGYYQYLYNIPVETKSSTYSMLNSGTNFYIDSRDSLVNKGTGYNYGAEFTLEKFFDKGYYMLFTTSLFQSKYKGSDGVERNTGFNGNYIFNLLAGKEFTILKNLILDVNLKQTFAGGRRYTEVDKVQTELYGRTIYLNDRAFENQFTPYNRTDLKVGVRFEDKKVTHELSVQINNLFDIQNVFTQEYDRQQKTLATNYQQGRLIIPQYRILF